MLVLTRKPNETVYIGEGIKVTIIEVRGNRVRLGVEAPVDQRVMRSPIANLQHEPTPAA